MGKYDIGGILIDEKGNIKGIILYYVEVSNLDKVKILAIFCRRCLRYHNLRRSFENS